MLVKTRSQLGSDWMPRLAAKWIGSAGAADLKPEEGPTHAAGGKPSHEPMANGVKGVQASLKKVLELGGEVEIARGNEKLILRHPGAIPSGSFKVISIQLDSRGLGREFEERELDCLEGLREAEKLNIFGGLTTEELQTRVLYGWRNLHALSLGDQPLTVAAVKSLSENPQLKELTLERCTGVSLEFLKQLQRRCPKMEVLVVTRCAVPHGVATVLAGLQKLRLLKLDGVSFTAEDIETQPSEGQQGADRSKERAFGALRNLEIVNGTEVSKDFLRRLLGSGIEALHLVNTNVSDAMVEVLVDAKHLKELNLSSSQVSNEAVPTLAKLTSLKSLTLLPPAKLTPIGLAQLSHLRLEELGYGDTGRPDFVVEMGQVAAIFPKLKRLVIGGLLPLNAGRLGVVEKFAALKEIRLMAPVEPEALLQLGRLRGLEQVDCFNSHFSDACAEVIAQVRNIEGLNLSHTRLTDQGLMKLAKMKRLKTLDVLGCEGLTDAGVAAFRREAPRVAVYR
jgi:hypothetical protein